MKPEQLEIDRLRNEVARLKAERAIPTRGGSGNGPVGCFPTKAAACFAREVT
jgi:hypothetical protein